MLSVFGLRALPRIARGVAERIGVPLLPKRGRPIRAVLPCLRRVHSAARGKRQGGEAHAAGRERGASSAPMTFGRETAGSGRRANRSLRAVRV